MGRKQPQSTVWQGIADELGWDDVGGRLLANIARGMYSPQAVLREYVQNAADAYKDLDLPSEDHHIILSPEGRNLSIQDFGMGMNSSGIRDAKKIAVSTKSNHDDRVGFRGIGIWAGLPACKRLVVDTTTAGDPYRYRLTFKFEDIMKHLDDNIHIKDLVDPRYKIEQTAALKDDHFTRVTLEELTDGYHQLLDPTELKRIASQVLPAAIDPNFQHYAALHTLLNSWPTYYECHIHIQTSDDKQEAFRHFPADDLEPPEEATLCTDQGVELARAWYCRSKRTSLQKVVPPATRGFQLRVKNFAVGGENMFTDEQGYSYNIQQNQVLKTTGRLSWFCGEAHVTNNEIRPNTPRDDLERDHLARPLIEKLRGFYKERILEAGAYSDFNPFKDALDEAESIVQAAKQKTRSGKVPASERIAKLLERLNDVPNRAKGTSNDLAKNKFKDLLRQQGFRDRCTKAIAGLKRILPPQAAEPSNGAEKATGATSPTKKGSNGRKKAKPTTSNGNERSSGNGDVKGEELLSQILEVLESYLGSDYEDLPHMQEDIQSLFDAWTANNA